MSKIDKSYLNSLSQTELFQQIATICEAVNTVVSAQELLDVSLRETLIVFRAQRGSIFITDKNKKDELVLVVSTGLQKEEQKAIVRRIGEGVIGKVAQLKQPIIVDDISSDERFKDTQPKGSYDTASFICAPLMVKDTLVGIINITDKDSGQKFNENEMQLLDFIATQIALNYRRIELYTKFKSTLQESKDLKHQLGKTNKQTQSLKRQIQIQEKLATIGKLAGGIAHEFNNPLDG
ncbi:MAG: GAF domain-containing protein, partial [Candidatus Omnitrophota bacterium]